MIASLAMYPLESFKNSPLRNNKQLRINPAMDIQEFGFKAFNSLPGDWVQIQVQMWLDTQECRDFCTKMRFLKLSVLTSFVSSLVSTFAHETREIAHETSSLPLLTKRVSRNEFLVSAHETSAHETSFSALLTKRVLTKRVLTKRI